MFRISCILFTMTSLLLAGCGSGGGNAFAPVALPAKWMVVFNAVSTARLPFDANGVSVDFIVPANTTIATTGTTSPAPIALSALTASSAVFANLSSRYVDVTGSYATANRQGRGLLTSWEPTGKGFRTGSLMVLYCTTPPDQVLTAQDVTLLGFSAVGYDPVSQLPTALNSYLQIVPTVVRSL